MNVDLFACEQSRCSRSWRRERLAQYSRRHGLEPGQYAIWHGMHYQDYFRQYGIFESAWRWFAMFHKPFQDEMARHDDPEEVQRAVIKWEYYEAPYLPVSVRRHIREGVRQLPEMCAYAERHCLRITWVPRNIHVLERIKQNYPDFTWDVVDGQLRLRRYPEVDGRRPSLVALLEAIDYRQRINLSQVSVAYI